MHIFSNVEAPEKNINLEVTADDLYGIHYEDRWTDLMHWKMFKSESLN